MSASSRKHRPNSLSASEESPSKRRKGAEENESDFAQGDVENVENNATISNGTSSAHKASRRSIGNVPGKAAECGVIRKVYVENFMCHAKLSVDLCRNVNFIHGQNGSGKSAILAAIQICLGAGARRTNRARNLKELVRKETTSGSAPSSAKIRVTLLNRGTDGYKPDVYGDEITVERTISLNGGFNGFKLLDCNGTEKSRDKKDLHEMLDYLNIQVENPVAILDQEEAKKFLMGKPEDKYNFFLKACELERIERTFSATMDKNDELKASHKKMVDSLKSAMERVDRLRAKYEEHIEMGKIQHKIQELSVNYAWAIFHGLSNQHRAAEEQMQQFVQKALAKQQELTQAEEAADGNDEESQRKKQKIQDLSNEAAEQAETKQSLEAELKALVTPFKTSQRDLANLNNRKQQAQRAVVEAKRKLQEIREEIVRKAGSLESEEAQRAKALQAAETELEECKEKVDALKQEYSDAQRLAEEAETKVGFARNAVNQALKKFRNAESTLQTLESSSAGNSSLAVFGSRVARVAQMVEDAKAQRQFTGPVEGPIGAYLKIVTGKEMYAELAELALGMGIMDRFVVTNDRDRKILMDIRRRVGCQQDCGVFQVCDCGPRFQVPDPPVDGVETVVTVLNISNDLVFNCLVDNAGIEKIGLGKSKEESQAKLLTTDESGKSMIRGGKINQVYFLPRGDMWQVRGGNTSLISNERKMRKTLSADMSQAIAEARRDFEQCQAELESVEKESHRWEGEHTKLARSWNQANRDRQSNDKKINDLIQRVDQLKAEMENAALNTTEDTSVYEDEVRQREEELSKCGDEAERLKRRIDEMKPSIEQTKAKIDEVTSRNEKIIEELTVAENAMTQFLETQSQKKDAAQKKKEKLDKYRAAIAKHEEKIKGMQSAVDKARRDARILHFRLKYARDRRESVAGDGTPVNEESTGIRGPDPTEEDLAAIEEVNPDQDEQFFEARIKRMKDKLEKEREKRKVRGESMEEAFQAYISAQEEIHGRNQEVESLAVKIASIEEDLKARNKRWKQFRRHLQDKTDIKFSEMLDLNKYTGKLDFNHETETLDLCVQKGGTEASQTKDVKALSGGERSYTTMCLLLALGESLETPFRILDEFDVFLDPHVRKLTIQALIHVAKKMEHRQFIFITPQDLTGIQPDPQLKIFKLKPPTRHNAVGPSQQTLNFSQVDS